MHADGLHVEGVALERDDEILPHALDDVRAAKARAAAAAARAAASVARQDLAGPDVVPHVTVTVQSTPAGVASTVA